MTHADHVLVREFLLIWEHRDNEVGGVFEVEGGRIKAWRDYFDTASHSPGSAP